MRVYRIQRRGDTFVAQYKSWLGWRHITIWRRFMEPWDDVGPRTEVVASGTTIDECLAELSIAVWQSGALRRHLHRRTYRLPLGNQKSPCPPALLAT
jgi:hypothetical protein